MPGESLSISPENQTGENAATAWDTLKNEPFKGALDPNVITDPFETPKDAKEPWKPEDPEFTEDKKIGPGGERSAFYRKINKDGTEGSVLVSEYFDLADEYAEAHKKELDANIDRKTRIALWDLRLNLALNDVSNGKFLDTENINTTEELKKYEDRLVPYYDIQKFLNDPNASPAGKQLVSGYLEQLKGKDLDEIVNNAESWQASVDALGASEWSYFSNKNSENQPSTETFDTDEAVTEALENREEKNKEQSEDRRRFEEQFSEIKDLLNRAENRLDESSSSIDKLNRRLDEIFEEKRFDEDELAYLRSNLYNAAEELYAASAKFDQTNQEYEAFVVQKKDQFSDNDYRENRMAAEENDDRVKTERKKAETAENRCTELRNLLSRLEELNRMPRF